MTAATRARILPLAVLVLAVFALLKLGNIWVGFSAAEAEESAAPETFKVENQNAEATSSDAPGTPPSDVTALPQQPSEVERRILEKLTARRESLDARERQLETREALLAAAEQRLESRLHDFDIERAQLEAMREEQLAGEAEEVGALISTYEKMKAKDAARIFDALDEEILVPVASGMRSQALAGVLAEMKPENARRLTRLLADRNKVKTADAAQAGQ